MSSRARCYSEKATRDTTSVVLDGKVTVVSGYGGEERMIAVHGPRRFLGELSLLTGQAAFFTAVVREPGEVLVVPVERLRALVTQDTVLGDMYFAPICSGARC